MLGLDQTGRKNCIEDVAYVICVAWMDGQDKQVFLFMNSDAKDLAAMKNTPENKEIDNFIIVFATFPEIPQSCQEGEI